MLPITHTFHEFQLNITGGKMLASERIFRIDAKVKHAESSIFSVLSFQVTKCDKGLVVSMHST